MRIRYQRGSLSNVEGRWIAQWRENGFKKKRTLGLVSEMTKSKALKELDGILQSVRKMSLGEHSTFGEFVEHVYLPFYRRKWKKSTAMTTEQRITQHLIPEFGARMLAEFVRTREELQDFLDRKAATGLSFSFNFAVEENVIPKNPARFLFTPKEAKRGEPKTMSVPDVRLCFTVLDLRERLIAKMAVLGRPRTSKAGS
jgi:hypothetical protein